MMENIVKIKSIQQISPDVLQLTTEKPPGYTFKPGQATEVSIRKNGWYRKKRFFSFTSPPRHDDLEFTIKTYPSHEGVTNEFLQLQRNDELFIGDAFGAIAYTGEGVFIAGGSGVTPFVCILRDLWSKNEIGKNKLILANKTKKDIILGDEFLNILGPNFINILSAQLTEQYSHGLINEEFLQANIGGHNRHFYLCGPPSMVEGVEKLLSAMGVTRDAITKEKEEFAKIVQNDNPEKRNQGGN
jgi:ferredoxin-NADP reductase